MGISKDLLIVGIVITIVTVMYISYLKDKAEIQKQQEIIEKLQAEKQKRKQEIKNKEFEEKQKKLKKEWEKKIKSRSKNETNISNLPTGNYTISF